MPPAWWSAVQVSWPRIIRSHRSPRPSLMVVNIYFLPSLQVCICKANSAHSLLFVPKQFPFTFNLNEKLVDGRVLTLTY